MALLAATLISEHSNIELLDRCELARSSDNRETAGCCRELARQAKAARIWQLIADRVSPETATFRERYNLNPRTYGTCLDKLLELSSNILRVRLVRNMLSMITKPEGQYCEP